MMDYGKMSIVLVDGGDFLQILFLLGIHGYFLVVIIVAVKLCSVD